MDVIKSYMVLLENPKAKKAYQDIVKYYQSKSMNAEAEAFEYLIKMRFDANNTSVDKE